MTEQRGYKGTSRKDAARAYHADAMTAMADRGFVPVSEQWGEFGDDHHVLVIYEYRPQDVAAARQGMVRLGYVDTRGRPRRDTALAIATTVGVLFFLPLYALIAGFTVVDRYASAGSVTDLEVAPLLLIPILVVLAGVWAVRRTLR